MFVALHSAKNDEFIGTCKIAHIDWYAATADIGIMIGNKSYWGKGVAVKRLSTCYVVSLLKNELVSLRQVLWEPTKQ